MFTKHMTKHEFDSYLTPYKRDAEKLDKIKKYIGVQKHNKTSLIHGQIKGSYFSCLICLGDGKEINKIKHENHCWLGNIMKIIGE